MVCRTFPEEDSRGDQRVSGCAGWNFVSLWCTHLPSRWWSFIFSSVQINMASKLHSTPLAKVIEPESGWGPSSCSPLMSLPCLTTFKGLMCAPRSGALKEVTAPIQEEQRPPAHTRQKHWENALRRKAPLAAPAKVSMIFKKSFCSFC